MVPILDHFFHRIFEMEMENIPFVNSFDNVLNRCCSLYRFHPKPVTYLYQSLYYYPRLRIGLSVHKNDLRFYCVKWVAFSRWLPSLYCRMRNSDKMTIEKTHRTLGGCFFKWGSVLYFFLKTGNRYRPYSCCIVIYEKIVLGSSFFHFRSHPVTP